MSVTLRRRAETVLRLARALERAQARLHRAWAETAPKDRAN